MSTTTTVRTIGQDRTEAVRSRPIPLQTPRNTVDRTIGRDRTKRVSVRTNPLLENSFFRTDGGIGQIGQPVPATYPSDHGFMARKNNDLDRTELIGH